MPQPNPNAISRRRFGSLAAATVVALPCRYAWADPVEPPPGAVVSYLPPPGRTYVGSPGLAVLSDGTYIAKHDLFGPGSTETTLAVTRLFRSLDRGATWSPLAEVRGMYWSSLFSRGPELFMIGTDREYGQAVAMRSDDGGASWTCPADSRTGWILPPGHYHTAPVPVIFHRGRVWRAMEKLGPLPRLRRFRALMMSAPADADLLDARSWTASNAVRGQEFWLGFRFGGWLEGNAVAAPDGSVVNILRVEEAGREGRAAAVRVSDDGCRSRFDPRRDFIRLPGGEKKFTIRFDPVSGYYWSLVNAIGEDERESVAHGRPAGGVRNTQALVRSKDLREWETRAVILHHPDPSRHGFQYLDWLFDGPDLIALSRTAWDDGPGGPPRAHDANFLTFHRIEYFRHLKR